MIRIDKTNKVNYNLSMINNLKEQIETNFGANLTLSQLWTLVKLGKHVRLRCRNNSAFNNCMNSLFPHAQFRQVQKTRVNKYTGQPESYPGLQITVNGQSMDGEDGED